MTQDPSALIRKISDHLAIKGIYLHAIEAKMKPDFKPHIEAEPNLAFQFRHSVHKVECIEVHNEGEDKILHWRFFADVGARIVDVGETQEQAENPVGRAEITVTFVAEYLQNDEDELDPDALQYFGQQNAIYHIWPYWRELLQSTCMRMNIPEIPLPMMVVKKKDSKQTPEKPATAKKGGARHASKAASKRRAATGAYKGTKPAKKTVVKKKSA